MEVNNTINLLGNLRISAEYGAEDQYCYHAIRSDNREHPFIAGTWSGFTEEEGKRIATLLAAAPDLMKFLLMVDDCLSQNVSIEKGDLFHKKAKELILKVESKELTGTTL